MEIKEIKSRVKTTFSIIFLFGILAVFMGAVGLVTAANAAEKSHVEFVSIPGNGSDVKPFKIGKTEVTNEQYVEFLNKALLAGKISD